MSGVSSIILAAGKGTRMGSDLAKVLHNVQNRPMVNWVLDACRSAGCDQQVVVVGHQREAVEDAVAADDVDCVLQAEQLGTGHAVLVTKDAVAGDIVVVCCGDAPLVPAKLLAEVINIHQSSGFACTAVAAQMEDPTGYGRMITDDQGNLQAIVEQKDASPEQAAIQLVNSGIYAFNRQELFESLAEIRPNNAQGEYYLTDVPKLLVNQQCPVGLVISDKPELLLGVNTPEQLAEVEALAAASR